jgi:serine/threonine protein kinase, bacterial
MAAEQFGKYRLLRLLARGRCEVYEAEHTTTRQRVALKIFSQRDSLQPTPFRVQREAGIGTRVLAQTAEPHWVLIHDVGAVDGRMYLQMPLIDGIDLQTLLGQQGPLTALRAVTIVGQVAAALDTAHTAGLVNRDIAAENVLVAPGDFAYVLYRPFAPPLDGKGRHDHTLYGTYSYTAPETFRTDSFDHGRSDIYSLACVLHHCLTGAPPFGGDITEQIAGHLTKEPPQPSHATPRVPPTFDGIIARGMAKNPEYRYASAGGLAEAAHAALATAPPDGKQ